jgi:hexosaminidase
MNSFHMHIGDDQGWRVEMKTFPALTTIGGQTEVGGARGNFFFTQVQMADLIKFAALRNVTIIPEFDLPGHTGAMFVSLPRLKGCANPDLAGNSIYTGIQTNWSSLCVGGYGLPAVQTYTDSVLLVLTKEIAGLFPSKYLNVGGDEADPTKGTPFNTFIQHMETVYQANGKYMVGWEEIGAARKLSTTWTIAWNHTGTGDINSNCEYQFIDHANNSQDAGAMGWCQSQVTLQNVYNTPMTSSNKGVECCLWSEYITNQAIADKRLYPRMLATAEVGWAASNSSWSGFATRIAPQGARMDVMGLKWFTLDGLVTWVRGTASTAYTSVFGAFEYSSTTPVLNTPAIVKSSHTQAITGSRIIDIRGRVLGQGPDMNALRTVSRGIYFIVDEKGNRARSPKKIFINE